MTVLQITRTCRILRGSSLLRGQMYPQGTGPTQIPHELTPSAKKVIFFLRNSKIDLHVAELSCRQCSFCNLKIRHYKVAVRPVSVTSPCAFKVSVCCFNTVMTSFMVGRASGALITHCLTSSCSTASLTRSICSWIRWGSGSSLMHISHNNTPKL